MELHHETRNFPGCELVVAPRRIEAESNQQDPSVIGEAFFIAIGTPAVYRNQQTNARSAFPDASSLMLASNVASCPRWR
jgi:hypothetical protein